MAEIFTLFDIPLQRLPFDESLSAVITQSHATPVRVFFVNRHSIVQAQEEKGYKRSLQLAEFCFSHGLAIQLAARFLGHPPIPQITPEKWIPALFDHLQHEKSSISSIFCLGGTKPSLQHLPHILARRWPHLTLVGCREAPSTIEEEDAVIGIIEQQAPSLLLVGSQAPENERFIRRHWHRLEHAGIKIAIASQGAIDLIAQGKAPRSAFRWVFHPFQALFRYIKGVFRFILLLIKQKGKQAPS